MTDYERLEEEGNEGKQMTGVFIGVSIVTAVLVVIYAVTGFVWLGPDTGCTGHPFISLLVAPSIPVLILAALLLIAFIVTVIIWCCTKRVRTTMITYFAITCPAFILTLVYIISSLVSLNVGTCPLETRIVLIIFLIAGAASALAWAVGFLVAGLLYCRDQKRD
jgi:uncharacterized membrane protein